jgi:hypothetical protein
MALSSPEAGPRSQPAKLPVERERWWLAPAIWDTGLWLCRSDDDGGVTAFAPPGIGLAENRRDDSASEWRWARWRSAECFAAGLLPDSQDPLGDLANVAELVPRDHHDWLARQAELHAAALESCARLIVLNPDSKSDEEVARLLDAALKEYADAQQLRSTVLRVGEAEEDRVRAEVIALMQLLHAEVDEAGNREMIGEGLQRLQPRLERLVRDHAYITRSRSWRWTAWLRTLRRAADEARRLWHRRRLRHSHQPI